MRIPVEQFKDVMAHWASGVTVVTTLGEDGAYKGTTVSAFTSVSLAPPLVSIALMKTLYTHSLLQQSEVFAVNILGRKQIKLGQTFAGMFPEIENRFAGHDLLTAATGCPIFKEALAWVDCIVVNTISAGDHTIFIGEVQAGENHQSDTPLLYFNRTWGGFSSD